MVSHLPKTKFMLKRITFLLPIFFGTAAIAQDTLSSINGKLQLAPVRNPWINTQNAAGLSVLPMSSMGRTYFGANIEDGDLRRPQQPSVGRVASFLSERYQPLQNASLYGKFSFQHRWDDGIRWSSVLDPYRRNPYIIADSIGGQWKKQLYDLELKASTPLNENRSLLIGAGIQYKVGTGARQNDPRPLTYTNDITLNPSFIWAVNKKLSLGVNGNFNFFKEKLSFSTSNNEDVHYRYRLAGLGYYYVAPSVKESRYYTGNTYGGSAQLQWEQENLRVLLNAGYSSRTDKAQDGTIRPAWYGEFKEDQYHASLNATLLTGTYTHQLEASWKSFDGDGKDLHYGPAVGNELPSLVNDDAFSSTFYNEGILNYRFVADRFQDDYKWMLNATVIYSGMDNRYNYPKARNTVDANEYRLAFTRNLVFSDSRNFIWGVNVALRDCFNQYNDYKHFGFQTDVVVKGLVNPEQEWFSSDIFKAGLSAEYRFPVSRGSETSLFIKAEGSIWKRVNTSTLPHASRNFAGLTIGMTY